MAPIGSTISTPRVEADRLARTGGLANLKRRPEIGTFLVMIAVVLAIAFASHGTAFNALGVKNNLSIIAQFGIIATGASLLMVAGEFDLSIGSMIGFAGMSMAMMLKWGLPFGLGPAGPASAFLITLIMTLALGWLIGTIVVHSRLSSFIVTLAFLFFLRGITEVCFRGINQSTQISGLPDFKQESWFAAVFGGESFQWLYSLWFRLGGNVNRSGLQWVTGLDARVVWWIAIAAVAYLVLSRTQAGNWIYATGDNRESARANGVPVNKVRIGLFMFTAFCATIFAACQVFDTNTADAGKGNLKELEAIAIAVVGGTLMTGGFGSVVGVAFGAITFGLVANAVFFIPAIDGSYYRVFVGIMLLIAVFLNESVRKRITGGI
ncbi:ABC transporter permease [Sinorhizobium meliloti]|uniref:ABC transporter permease n=1 Tax=Rhizobium meliloti TaxID=382 RepID=UPI000FD20A47|nr:ABC transporter permease [Sinorhizobium meliloti]MQV24836.1 ABC transporter permease [Sinorhizobium meliloti]MQV37494.1 ABC transporter permease [Sinorhizobium meliloti]RVE79208.1 ABC transporter permease [Sinorhizobium meliloti]RVG42718.1 ABC transporter permease [Sinorhizobium meliloti]RVM08313.1 ABC transporter permease [Sinorhizobium meliloti]